MFCCSRTTYLEQLTCESVRQGSQLHIIQKTTENIHVSDGLRRIVTFLIIAPYKYFYLLTYALNSTTSHNRVRVEPVLIATNYQVRGKTVLGRPW